MLSRAEFTVALPVSTLAQTSAGGQLETCLADDVKGKMSRNLFSLRDSSFPGEGKLLPVRHFGRGPPQIRLKYIQKANKTKLFNYYYYLII